MHYDSPIAPLLEGATRGSESSWREIIVRYTPLVLAVCRRYGIRGADAEDVSGAVWMHLVTHLNLIREPEALPGWLRTTVRHECLMLLRQRKRQIPVGIALFGEVSADDVDKRLIEAEWRAATRNAFARLPHRDQKLLLMLFSDPPTPYREISSTLGIPIGAIGPTRARCLARARRTPAIVALLGDHQPSHGMSTTAESSGMARRSAVHIQFDEPHAARSAHATT